MSSIERRAFLRYSVAVPVELINQYGATFKATTRDISLGGMKVDLESTMLNQLLPEGIQTAPSDQVVLNSNLYNPKTEQNINLQCHVLGVLRLSESEFSIRFSFLDVDEVQKDQLQRLLNK